MELLAAARGIVAGGGGEVVVVAPGENAARFAAQLGAADRILVVDDPLLAAYSPEPYLAVLQQAVAAIGPKAVLIASTSIGWDLAPMLAGRLDAPIVSGCKAVRAEGAGLVATASFCGGKMLAEVELKAAPAVLMLLPGSVRPTGEAGKAKVETLALSAPLSAGGVSAEEYVLPAGGDVDITQQEVLVAVGRGIQQKDNLELAEELAQALGGAVCASRPVVDQGWLPATRQVGKSGMTVKPKLYIALGISGAPEHQEGMKGADLIIAVNTDPKAPIFDVAHYGAEVDVLDLLPPLTAAIQAMKA